MDKNFKIGIIGLGYVDLPLAVEFEERITIPLKGEDTYVCPKKNKTYILKHDTIIGID